MKVVMLAGGLGTRLSEETVLRPKPMVEIGEKPIIWHIFRHYNGYGFDEFIVCCGYKSYVIKEYFYNYFLHVSDVTFDFKNDDFLIYRDGRETWKITFVENGKNSLTGTRILKIRSFIGEHESFMLAYGDGLSDVGLKKLLAFHKSHDRNAMVTTVAPPSRFGSLMMDESTVTAFDEKPLGDGARINGGFWKAMDTLRDREVLQEIWKSGKSTWLPQSVYQRHLRN